MRLETGPDERYARKRVIHRFTAHTLGGSATPAPQAPIKPVPFDMAEWRRRWGAYFSVKTPEAIRKKIDEYDRLHGKKGSYERIRNL